MEGCACDRDAGHAPLTSWLSWPLDVAARPPPRRITQLHQRRAGRLHHGIDSLDELDARKSCSRLCLRGARQEVGESLDWSLH